MDILVTKQQLLELKNKLNPLIKKALVGEPIEPVTHFMQGLVPIGEETIVESPDKVLNNYDDLIAHWSNDDAIAFGFLNNQAFITYNNELFFDSTKIPQEKKDFIDHMNYKLVEKMMAHAGLSSFYKVLYGNNGLGSHRSQFEYPGRLWFNKKIISFWSYPDKNKLTQLLKSLSIEIDKIYGVKIDFSNYRIEIKTNEYQADLNMDDEDYEPDLEWETNKKIGNLIPIKDFISSNDATDQEMQNIHSLPSDEKRKTPQMQAARDVDAERLGDKFNGNVSQAEWNNAKKKYQGESKTYTNRKQIKEDPDTVYMGFGEDSLHYDDVDAIPFGLDDNKMYVGYNKSLWSNISDIDPMVNVYGENTHTCIEKFYNYLVNNKLTNNDITYVNNTDNFTFPGRLWTISKIVSFWTTPPPNKIIKVLEMLKQELKLVYGYELNVNMVKIEVKGELIPIRDYSEQGSAPEKLEPKIHLLPSDEKRKTPQMQAAREADAERLSNKFNGNVNQAEWNNAKKKYQGESKTFKITSSQLNEIKKHLNEEFDLNNCPFIEISNEISEYINKFTTDEEFLRSGGLPVNMLDRIAFGFADEDIKTINPKQLNIKWKDDLNNVIWEIKRSGLPQKEWAKKINLTEPIDVSYEKNKFYIEDGHHRYCAAKILGRDLNINLEINMNPTEKIASGLGYDNLCRCLFKQVKNEGANPIMREQLMEQYVYHASVKPIGKILPDSKYTTNRSGYYPGMYFFNDKEISNKFYDPIKYNIYKTNIDGLKIYDLKDGDELKQLASKNGVDVNAGSGYREAYWLESQGYDGIKRGQYEVILFKPENLNIEKVENIDEDIKLPVNVGDTVLMGKFKNKKTVVKKLDKDSHGMPTINGKQAATFRTTDKKEKIEEGKDYVYGNYNGETIEVSNEDWDAVPFVYFNNKVYVGYNPDLGESYKEKGYKDDNNENRWSNFHADIAGFYSFMGDKTYIPTNRGGYEYSGRIWYDRNVVSFYKYPQDASKMKEIMLLLNDELNKIYGETFDFDNFIVDTTDDGLVSMNDYIGSNNASDKVINSPHLLSPEQKKNSPQLKAVRDYDVERLANKFSGETSQAEWNAAKNKYRGESIENKVDSLITETTIKYANDNDEYDESFYTEPTKPGEYELLRGSHNGNYNISKGIYANGIHFTTDMSTALEFGEPYLFRVKLEKPIVLTVPEIKKIGTPLIVTNKLISLGYDSLVIPHVKTVNSNYDEPSKNYTEYEVVIFNGNNLVEATEADVNLSSFKPKNELNEKFWVNEKIKPVIRKRLLKIADDFIDFLKIDIKKIEDVLFLGSLANYNWSKYSDVDLHLVIDMKKINKDIELVKDYFDAKKKVWSVDHDELKICGFPVEIYIQDKSEQNASVGMFSLEKNKWLNKPVEINDEDFNKQKIKEKAAKLMTDIDDLLNDYKNKPNFNQLTNISNKSKKLYDKIKRLRKQGLDSEAGEMSIGNIVFKVLRRNEYLGKLIDLKSATYDKINSIK